MSQSKSKINRTSNIVDETIYLFDYKNYWIEDTAQGHLIKICHGSNDRVLEIDCRWKDRKRDKSNRPIKISKKHSVSQPD
jgi:hypothetical protein